MKKVYYARPVNLYGTFQDQRDIALLVNLGFDVVNPDKQQLSDRYKLEGMSVFLEALKDCDVLAFRSFPDLKISAGVAKEIDFAIENRLTVIELPTITEPRIMSVQATREYLSYLGNR